MSNLHYPLKPLGADPTTSGILLALFPFTTELLSQSRSSDELAGLPLQSRSSDELAGLPLQSQSNEGAPRA